MTNAKIQNDDLILSTKDPISESHDNYNYILVDGASPTGALEDIAKAYNPNTGVPGSAVISGANTLPGMNSYLFRAFSPNIISPQYLAFIGINAVGGVPENTTFNVNALQLTSPLDSSSVTSWVRNADGDVTLTFSSNHGWSVGDYISIESDNFGDNSLFGDVPAVYFWGEGSDTLDERLPFRIHSVPALNQVRIYNDGIVVETESIEPLTANVVRKYDKVKTSTFELSDTPQNILFDMGDIVYDGIIAIDYVANTDGFDLYVKRIMSGTYFQSVKNIQPPDSYPTKDSEPLEMADGSFRYEIRKSSHFSSVEWLSLTEAEWQVLFEIIDENQLTRAIIFNPFPNHALPGWELKHAMIGVIQNASQNAFLEDGTKYQSSARFELVGDLFDQIL